MADYEADAFLADPFQQEGGGNERGVQGGSGEEDLAASGRTHGSVPSGAFYVFANVGEFSQDSLKFALELLDEAKVATAPGIDFGSNGEGFLRFSYATSSENIREGVARIGRYLSTL